MTQWDFQNKRKYGWTGKNSFVLKVPLRHLRPSVIYSVPCDRILQRAYWVLRISHTLAYVWSLLCGVMWMRFKIPQGHPLNDWAHDQQKPRTYKANESMYSPLIPRSPKHSPRGIPRQRWSTAVTWVPRYTLMENKKYDKPFLAILEH